MSRKTKTLRAFLHQTRNPTIEQAWDAAWKHAQKTFHARSMQDMEEKLAAAQAECEKLQAECDSLRKDAERYWWLRDMSETETLGGSEWCFPSVPAWEYRPGAEPNEPYENLDLAIDAAIKGEES